MQDQYWTMLALGAVAAVLLMLGLTNLIVASMPWAHTGLHAHVTGVYPYDRNSGSVGNSAGATYAKGRTFAARVDWAALPADVAVGAVWYDSNGGSVGGITPGRAGDLAGRNQAVPMADSQAPPGSYTLLVMHYVGDTPIEVLARTTVRISKG